LNGQQSTGSNSSSSNADNSAQLAVTVANCKQKSSCKKQLTDVVTMTAGCVSVAIMQTLATGKF